MSNWLTWKMSTTKKVIFDTTTFINVYFIYQPTHVIIIKTWVMPIERAVTIHRTLQKNCVTTNSLRDGIVLWEMQEQECQQHVCQHSDVVHTGQAGWMVLILQWKMVKLKGKFALVIVRKVANTLQLFLWKTVDLTSSTNFSLRFVVPHATVVQTECEANILSVVRRLTNRSVATCVQGF